MSLEFKFLVGPELVDAEAQLPENQRVAWPIDSIIMFAYEDGKVVGRMGLMSIKIIEGTYVAPGHTTLAYRMMKQMEAFLAYLGNTHAMAIVYDGMPQVADYLQRVDFTREPLTLYSKEVAKKAEAA